MLITSGTTEQVMSNLDQALLDTYLHRSLLAFARPLLETPKPQLARTMSTSSSMRMLTHLECLDSHDWTFITAYCAQDIFQAALIVCLMVDTCNKGKKAQGMSENNLQSFME